MNDSMFGVMMPVPAPLSGHRGADRLMSAARLVLDLHVRGMGSRPGPPPPPPTPPTIDCRIVGKSVVAEHAIKLVLAADEGARLPPWDPGAHVDLYLPSGLIRQYSLCGAHPERTTYTVIVRDLDARGPTEIRDQLRGGDGVAISRPRNTFPFAHPRLRTDGIDKVIFVAAGIGITALAQMVRLAAATGVEWQLRYLGRSKASMPLIDDLADLDPDRSRIGVIETHDVGRPTPASILTGTDSRTAVYACGPPTLLTAMEDVARRHGVGSWHAEAFTRPRNTAGQHFTITLARSGKKVQVHPDISALEAVEAVVPGVAYSCRRGFCGTCRVSVLDGHVQRRGRATFLDDATDSMLLCSDGADTDVTIDL